MAKILVADDNSNVQKTVAHALTDLGVEVVSVNNGDAAIKRFADIAPDLVLADIFMPVRNGYEVCEYVKKTARSAHIPVVLLVGAFDPLDEREAQRVGADGILKKPFVPPDPLLTMVKTLLDRSMSERLVTVSATKPAASVPAKASSAPVAETSRLTQVEPEEETAPVEFPAPVRKLSFEGERPVAFGELLDPPAQSAASGTGVIESVDDEQVLTGTRDAALGDPIFWQEPEAEPEPASADSRADDNLRSNIAVGDWDHTEESQSHQDEETSPAPVEESLLQPVDAFELVRDEGEEGADEHPTVVDTSSSIPQDPASVAPLNVRAGRAEDLAANPIEWMASAPPVAEEKQEVHAVSDESLQNAEKNNSWTEPAEIESAAEPVTPGSFTSPTKPVAAPETISIPAIRSTPAPAFPSVTASAPPVANPPAVSPDPIKTPPSVKSTGQKPEDTAHSIATHDWEDLAATLRPLPVPSAVELPKIPATPTAPVAPIAPAASIAPAAPVAPPAPAPVETDATPQAAKPKPVEAAGPDPAVVEAVVQRVLDKMRPQVLDVITKEFLRPIVQALVHREIEKP